MMNAMSRTSYLSPNRRCRDYGEGHGISESFYDSVNDDGDASDIALDDTAETKQSANGGNTTLQEDGSIDVVRERDNLCTEESSLSKTPQDKGVQPTLSCDDSKLKEKEPGQMGNSSNMAKSGTQRNNARSSLPVALYVPNILGYIRIILSFYGLHFAIKQQPSAALNTWIAAAILDLFDGMAARALGQCSKLGVLLDVVADNILRSVIWIAAVIEAVKYDPMISIEICIVMGIICVEWITMFCAQSNHDASKGKQSVHWKDVNKKKRTPPFLVRAVFKNNFRTIPGTLAIYGLFVAPIGSYVWYGDRFYRTWPSQLLSDDSVYNLIALSYFGRLLAFLVEAWVCFDYICNIIAEDEQNNEKMKDT